MERIEMKGFYKPTNKRKIARHAIVYECNHKLYNSCTLFQIDERSGFGLAVIQERFNPRTKMHWWGAIDPWLADDIFMNENFIDVFRSLSDAPIDGLYRTITVRSLMNLLKMKPMKREYWETSFTSQNLQGI